MGLAGQRQDDAALMAALKAGTTAVLSARRARAPRPRTPSALRGFTAAMEDAGKRCQ
jgi:invasion protein IalB